MQHMSDIDLIKYAAGEFSDARTREIEAHLGACDTCRREASDLADVRVELGAWTVDASSGDLWAAIEGRLDARRPQAGRLCHKPAMVGRYWHLAGQLSRIAAAVVFGVGLGYLAGRSTWPMDRSQPIIIAEASELAAADELGLYILESVAAAGLFTTVLDLTDAAGGAVGTEVAP